MAEGRQNTIVGIGSRPRSERRRSQPVSYSMSKGTYCSGGKVAAVMELTTKHHLAPWLRYALMACCLMRSVTALLL